MYRIIKIDGTELGVTDSVNYIKISENGCFTNTTEKMQLVLHLIVWLIIWSP